MLTYTCTECTETKTEVIPILKFNAFGVTLKNNIQLNYKVNTSTFDVSGYTDAYVKFIMKSKDGSIKTVIVTKEEARYEQTDAGKDFESVPITRSIKGYVEDRFTNTQRSIM